MEILNIPDNIPKTVLDKSECVIVIPSVKKKTCSRHWRKLWPRRHDLPRRRELFWRMGSARDG